MNKLIQIEPMSGVQRWALAFVGGKDTGDVPKSCFNCPFLYINQKRCQIHGPDIVIDRVTKDGQVYTPVCCYQRGGTPLAVGDNQVVYNVNTLGDKAADQTGLEWAKSPTGTNCGGFNQGAKCEHFISTDGKGVDGLCDLMSKNQDEASNAMSEHKGQSVDWDDCCDGHEGDNISWREAQKLIPYKIELKPENFLNSGTENSSDEFHQPSELEDKRMSLPQEDKLTALFVRHGQTEANKDNLFRGPMNFPLDNTGRQQALDARGFLASYLGDKPIGASYRSSKARTGEMADLTLGPGRTKVVKNFDALNVGDFSGKPKSPENMKAIMHYQKHPEEKIPGGERINDFRERTNPEIKRAISEGEKTGRPSISFVHSSTIHQVSHLLHGDHNLVKVTPGGIVGVFRRSSGSLYAKALLHESQSKQDKQMMS